jgi:hypothetical protein
MRTFVAILALAVLAPAEAVEPGLRVKAGLSALKLLGTVGENIGVGGADFTIGAGGYVDLSYRLQESFAMGLRGSWHGMGISGTDQEAYDRASFQEILLVSMLVFDPDEETRPFATVGLGLSWLGWDHAEPYRPYPADEPDFTITDDRRRATTFLFGGGAEIAMGEWWELVPALHVRLNGWSDHTDQGIPDLNDDDESVAPTTVAFEATVGLARRF